MNLFVYDFHFNLTFLTNFQFYIKGVDYQPGGSSGFTDEFDPLSNPKVCARDIALFQKLGVNVSFNFSSGYFFFPFTDCRLFESIL